MYSYINRIIYTYSKNEYNSYRQKLREQDISLCSISEFLSEHQLGDLNEFPDKFVIDFSTMATTIKTNDTIAFQFEQLLPKMSNDVVFVIEDKYVDDFLYAFRYCFDKYEKLVVEVMENTPVALVNKLSEHDVRKITDFKDDEIVKFFEDFDSKLYGHERFKNEFRNIVDTFRVFNKIGEHKILSLFLMGDSGIGKTEVARVIHKCLGSKKKLAKISFGNYSSKDALNTLIGSPLGYIGSDGGELIKRINESDIGLILIDEFEKADGAVFNYFLDVLENGKVTNTQADEYDCDGYIIVFTSNITKGSFERNISPELRSRFDYKGVFNSLTVEDKKKFVFFRVNEIIRKYNEKSGKIFDEKKKSELLNKIEVSNYNNMRELNKKIKDEFVKSVKKHK